MRKLELIRALLGLEQAHAAIVEDRHRVSVAVFESPVDRRLPQGHRGGGVRRHQQRSTMVILSRIVSDTRARSAAARALQIFP